MRSAAVTARGYHIRWAELPVRDPVRAYVDGLGATCPAYLTGTAVRPLLTGRR
ncbi:hypothetical protein ACFU3E_03930 [Streptomyces sp. NPDC057424]|uniref:hypothetical protein n=1 Tax=Streptomyces sp. NPDC057424 TaxID=3346127 RepID=UPI00369AA06E